MVMLPMTLAEPYPPKTTSIFTFCIALCIFVIGYHRLQIWCTG